MGGQAVQSAVNDLIRGSEDQFSSGGKNSLTISECKKYDKKCWLFIKKSSDTSTTRETLGFKIRMPNFYLPKKIWEIVKIEKLFYYTIGT